MFLSPLQGFSIFSVLSPTACAVGCRLSPLRGWDLKHETLRKFLLFGVRFFSKFGLYPQGTDWYYASVTAPCYFSSLPRVTMQG